jgi:hypothetical protein
VSDTPNVRNVRGVASLRRVTLTPAPMRLRSLLPGIRDDVALEAAVAPTPLPLNLSGVWGTPTPALPPAIGQVVYADVFGAGADLPLSRAEAMRVPAVERARHIIAGTVAVIPLRAYRGGQVLEGPAAPPWLTSTSGALSPFHRLLWTADDLLFHGWSAWALRRGAGGVILNADRIPPGQWSADRSGIVYVDRGDGTHVLVDQRSVQLIPGPHEGILTADPGTIRHAAALQHAAAQAAKTPAAYLGLRQTSGTPLKLRSDDATEVTVETTLADWRAARAGLGGGVAFIPLGLEPVELGTFSEHLLTEGRNAAAVDVARIVSLPADLLDAAGPSSLTYATTRDNNKRAIQYGVGAYLSAIAAALSQDGMTAHGQEVRFDLQDWLEDPTADDPATEPAPADVPRETTPAPLSAVPSSRESA